MKAGGRLLIEGGLVIDPSQRLESRLDVLIRDGKILEISSGLSRRLGAKAPFSLNREKRVGVSQDLGVVDARGCWVIPGVIDMHVHLREPGREEDETILTGTRAAAAGGVCTLLAMPNTLPPTDTASRLLAARRIARRDAAVHVLFAGALTRGQQGEALCDLEALFEAGAAALSDDGRPVMNAEFMRRALLFSRVSGLPVLDHAEDAYLAAGGVLHEGRRSRRLGLPGIPSASETLMALRDVSLAALTGGRLHLCHVSCAETVDLVRRAKRSGLALTAEASPHHLTLTEDDIPRGPRCADFKMNPPLRSRGDREALLEGLQDGTIDAIASDHAPHAPEKKAWGPLKAPFGIIGLETLLPLSLALAAKGVLTRRSLVERLSAAPARILGLRAKGHLRRGADADVTVIDPAKRYRVSLPFRSKSRNSPFLGRSLRGTARAAIVAGRVVFLRAEEEV